MAQAIHALAEAQPLRTRLSGRWATNAAGTALAETPEIILELPVDSCVQFASDLHLEYIPEGEADLDAMVTPNAPILALLGDIGIPTHPIYRQFLLRQAERFRAVLVLTGNHEFYDSRPPAPPPMDGAKAGLALGGYENPGYENSGYEKILS